MRLLICAGGTGGGVYPALAVLQALNDLDPTWMTAGAVLWVGGEDSMEGEIISRQNIPYQAIPAAGLHGVSLRKLPRNISLLLRGYRKAGEIIRTFRPDVLLFTGGYLAVPAAFAGRSLPSLVYIPDIEPGLAIKTISNLVSEIAVSVEETRSFTPAKKPVVVSGYPVREELLTWSKERACEVFDLNPSQPILLVFGGSKGARSINYALLKILPALLKEIQVIHITGNLDWQDINVKTTELNEDEVRNYRVYPFLHEKMGAALKAADLVVSRSGASILGEYPMFGLPAILVPYPHAWRYQKTNADYLVQRGAADLIQDSDLNEELYDRIQLLMKDPQKLSQMRDAMERLANPDAARTIANRLFSLAEYIPGGEK